MNSRQIATFTTPVAVGAIAFSCAAFLMDDAAWARFGYGYADRAPAATACLLWAIAGFTLRWNQHEKPLRWSAYLLLSAIAYGGIAVAFAFQGSYTGAALFGQAVLFCYESNELHTAISRVRHGDRLDNSPRDARLKTASSFFVLAVVACAIAIAVAGAVPLETLGAGFTLLVGAIPIWSKMADSLTKISAAIGPLATGAKPVIPVTLEALADVNGSLRSEIDFKSAEIERLRATIVRIRSRLPDHENTELPFQ